MVEGFYAKKRLSSTGISGRKPFTVTAIYEELGDNPIAKQNDQDHDDKGANEEAGARLIPGGPSHRHLHEPEDHDSQNRLHVIKDVARVIPEEQPRSGQEDNNHHQS